MNPRTLLLHRRIVKLGEDLGFDVSMEASASVLALNIDAYTPRPDVLWSLRLDRKQAAAVAAALGEDAGRLERVPIVGFEVEGGDPTTKILESDLANLASVGAPLGLLVVSEEEAARRTSPGMYRRAVRMVRTLRKNFGEQPIVPIDASFLPSSRQLLASRPRRDRLDAIERTPRGGETTKWSKETRRQLCRIGSEAGFTVVEPYVPPSLRERYTEDARRGELRYTFDPLSGVTKVAAKSREWLTESHIDLAWMLRLPPGLRRFLEHLAARDPHLGEAGLLRPMLFDDVAVVGFELDTSTGKHATGGFLNLSPYCVTGVMLAPTDRAAGVLRSALTRYQPTLGLRNVRVRTSAEVLASHVEVPRRTRRVSG